MTSQTTTAPTRPITEIPCLTCPHCGATEPRALIGKMTRAIISLNPGHFTDGRGYFYCRACLMVWDRLPHGSGLSLCEAATADERERMQPRRVTDPWVRLGVDPGFHGTDRTSKRLERIAMTANAETVLGSPERVTLTRISDRVRDADTLCTALRLDAETRDIVLEHVEAFSVKADLRKFPRIPDTKGHGYVRAEAYLVATVLIVAEQMKVNVDTALAFEHFTFTKGRRELGASEVKTAMRSLHSWFRDHYWMQG